MALVVLAGPAVVLSAPPNAYALSVSTLALTLTMQDVGLTYTPLNALLVQSGTDWLAQQDGDTLTQNSGGATYSLAVGTMALSLTMQSVTLTYTQAGGSTFSTETGDNIVIGMTAWAATTALGSSITMGSITGWFRTNASNLYYASSGGTTGSTAPTHTSGTASDGTITWEYCCSVDYTSFASWISAMAGLGTFSAAHTGIIWADAEITSAASNVIDITGITPTSSFRLTLKAKEELAFYSHASAVLRYDATKGIALRNTASYSGGISIRDDYVTIKGLQVATDSTTTGQPIGEDGQLSGQIKDRCIFKGAGSFVGYNLTGTIRNCLFDKHSANTSSEAVASIWGATMVNCTIVRPSNYTAGGKALNSSYGTFLLRNCVVCGFTTACTGTYTGSEYNASEDADAKPSGTGDVSISAYSTAEFVQPDASGNAENWKIVTGSVLKNAGVTDTTNIPDSKDIFGTTRSTWDIGAHEYV